MWCKTRGYKKERISPDIRFGSISSQIITFAGDTAGFATNADSLQNIIKYVADCAKINGLELNAKKVCFTPFFSL